MEGQRPKFFESPTALIDLPGFEGIPRWTDTFLHDDGSQRILTAQEWSEKDARDRAYRWYLSRFSKWGIKGKQIKFQAVRLVDKAHAFTSRNDWWHEYLDSVFRVFMQPHTQYDSRTRAWFQWYVLCPEDVYLVHCYNRFKRGFSYPPRKSFKWVSPHKELRKLLLIPTECSYQLRHETTAGELPAGL